MHPSGGCGPSANLGAPTKNNFGPVVKWYYAAFALLRREFDSPQVHMKNSQEYIDILISLEPIFKQAGELALKMRKTAKSKNKYDTGNPAFDIVTEADTAVQEFILFEMLKTKLADCKIMAEESTPSISKFKELNGLVLTLDPIDGTAIYASTGKFWSVIVSMNDGENILYTFLYYPDIKWSRRIISGEIEDSGEFPKFKLKENLNVDFNKAIYCHNSEDIDPKIYRELTGKGYKFYKRTDLTEERGSYILLFSRTVAGSYITDPNPYDGLVMLHYGQAANMKIYSSINVSNTIITKSSPRFKGWYLALNK